jgi:hypothetical protein
VSAAFVVVNKQLPANRALTTPEATEQLAVPEVTLYNNAPVPEPPDTDNVIPVSKSPEVSRTDNKFCESRAKVTVVAAEDFAS